MTLLARIEAMGINAEMTCTSRAAIHRYTFPESDAARVLIDLNQGIKYCGKADVDGKLVRHGKRALSGHVNTTAWGEHTTWFYMEFSKPFELADRGEKGGIASFSTAAGEAVHVKVGISYVSAENAKLDLQAEIPQWDFDRVRHEAKAEWNAQLAKFDVKGGTHDQHALYAYNYVGAPAKAAEKVRLVLEKEYRNDHWGISGNEDAGQMSAWYIFSAMGFYPYMHSVPEYTIGSPIVDEVTLNLPNGKTCVITAKNNSAENIYVQSLRPHDLTL